MSELMIYQHEAPVTVQRKTKARIHHIDQIRQITKEALNVQADIYRQSFMNLITEANQAEFLAEAYRLKYGNGEDIHAVLHKHLNDLQAFNTSIYNALGEKLLDIINSMPTEPQAVGFWEEVSSRLNEFLISDNQSVPSAIDEIRQLGAETKRQLENATRETIETMKESIREN